MFCWSRRSRFRQENTVAHHPSLARAGSICFLVLVHRDVLLVAPWAIQSQFVVYRHSLVCHRHLVEHHIAPKSGRSPRDDLRKLPNVSGTARSS